MSRVIIRVMEIVPEEAPDQQAETHQGRSGDDSAHAGSTAPIPGQVISTWTDSWTFCKATAKSLSAFHWVPWLGAASAVISAITATAVFSNLEGQVSTAAKVIVGAVAVLVALVTALQSWTSGRTKALIGQMNGFDRLHNKIQRDIENHSKPSTAKEYVSLDAAYADDIRNQYQALLSEMTPVSNRYWDAAKRDVRREMTDELRRFGYMGVS